MAQTNPETVAVALYATQGGGFATFKNGHYVWHSEIPDSVDAKPGDPIPDMWDAQPANEAARSEAFRDEFFPGWV